MKIEEIGDLLDTMEFRFEGEHYDKLKGMSVVEVARIQKTVSDVLDKADRLKKDLQKCYDAIRYTVSPEVMEKAEVETIRIDGVGTMYLTSDYNISIAKDKKEEAYDWLTENGHEDVIIETVNSSSLKSIIKGHLKAGDTLPEGIFNINPFTRAQIKK